MSNNVTRHKPKSAQSQIAKQIPFQTSKANFFRFRIKSREFIFLFHVFSFHQNLMRKICKRKKFNQRFPWVFDVSRLSINQISL